MEKQYIASLSYGKDSLAMLHVITDILHWPLTRIITADVWATDTIPAELPPMVEFKEKADEIIKERWGIDVEHLCAKKNGSGKETYEQVFYTEVKDKQKYQKRIDAAKWGKCHNPNGRMQYIYGFPCRFGPWCNSKLKIAALDRIRKEVLSGRVLSDKETDEGVISGGNRWMAISTRAVVQRRAKEGRNKGFYREIESEVVQYIGIAADEGARTERHIEKVKQGLEQLPLVEAGWTEQMCRDWCEQNGLLSPTYTTATRGGCWFCHNQGIGQLRLLRHNYPDLWALMLKWDEDSPVTFHADGKTVHDIDRRLQMEDEGYIKPGDRFRWADIEEPQMNIFQFIEGSEE